MRPKRKHTLAMLAMIAALVAVTACTDDPEALTDDPEVVLEVAFTDGGVLGLTKASTEHLEEAVLATGGLDTPLRFRVSGPDGVVIREVAADSYHDLMTTMAQEGVVNMAAIEKEVDGLLAAMASGELEIDVAAWREAAGDLQSVFESFDSLRFIEVQKKVNAKTENEQ